MLGIWHTSHMAIIAVITATALVAKNETDKIVRGKDRIIIFPLSPLCRVSLAH